VKRRIIRKWFWVWEFEEEEQWLNQMAESGWALEKVGFAVYYFRLCVPGAYTIRIEMRDHDESYLGFMKELDAEGIPYNPDTELGIMIETPSSVFVAEELAKLVDFFSVGTNDLTQYTLACDRQANDLGKFYDPHHPALLRAIKMTADAAHKAGIWIGICGELGADISMLPTFLAMGIDELSVSPAAVLPLRAAIRQSIAQTCTLEMLEC